MFVPVQVGCQHKIIRMTEDRSKSTMSGFSQTQGQLDQKSVSMRSDWSMKSPICFRESPVHFSFSQTQGQLDQMSVSMRSDWSMKSPICFRESPVHFREDLKGSDHTDELPQTQLDTAFKRLEENIFAFVQEELKRFRRALSLDHPQVLENEEDEKHSCREAVLKITLDFLRGMKLDQMADRLHSLSQEGICHRKLKRRLEQRFSCVFEGITKSGSPPYLNQIYTELYITEGEAAGVNEEHEVRFIENDSRKQNTPETTIKCEDIFKGFTHRRRQLRAQLTNIPIRTVVTKGVAGIGKTVLTQKFSLDWAEGRANQDIQLLFPFSFRELNVLRDREFSLVGLLHHFFSESKTLSSFEHVPVVIILDGLDECRFPLDFIGTRVLTDPTEFVSLDLLIINLIRGSLLPSAHIWITTRPAAANQIPADCISMVTEVRGFTDMQKEQYFMKRFKNRALISHIKNIRSLHIMCHIPVFCWILSTVIRHLLKSRDTLQLPHTLTQMYIHFLVVQIKTKNFKYDGRSEAENPWTPENKRMVESLGKLAFEQLQKGNFCFFESDLVECGLDTAEASVYSGVFTEVFSEEIGLYQDKFYCFIHLSVQEFLAALHVHLNFYSYEVNLLSSQTQCPGSEEAFYQCAVDQALKSPNGSLDLFLQFLLGLSHKVNQSKIRGLVTHKETRPLTNKMTALYIQKKLDEGFSAEASMNLFHCLNELHDRSLVDEIQKALNSGHMWNMSPAQWSGVGFLLLSSGSELKHFDLKKYCASEEVLERLLMVVKASTKALLSYCHLSLWSCKLLSAVMSSSSLTHLDLSNNDLQDAGVQLLCSGLRGTPCKLQTLRLSGCLVSEEGGVSLASALSSVHSRLRELDLSYNHPGASAERLIALLDDPHCPLCTLWLEPFGHKWLIPGLTKYFCELTLDLGTANRKLRLSGNCRAVRYDHREQPYPDLQSRFSSCPQMLCSSPLNERSYWELEWELHNNGSVYVAVCYSRISREGDRKVCGFGRNQHSWALRISRKSYSVYHENNVTVLPHTPQYSQSSRSSHCLRSGPSLPCAVAVYLDYKAGFLSFYEVSSTRPIHLHTFYATFTDFLYAGFRLKKSSVYLVDNKSHFVR